MTEQQLLAWGSEMRAVHERLRDALVLARESIEAGEAGSVVARDLQLFCWGFCVALNGHHRGEDSTIFPWILERRPELAPVVSNLIQDHNMISSLIQGLERSVSSSAAPMELLRHLDGIEAVMETHFGYEERQIADILDDVVPAGAEPSVVFGPLA